LVTTIFTTLAIIIGLRWGVVGVATGYTFMGLLLFYPEVFITFRVADLKVRDFFSNFKSELISSVTMILIILILKIILQQVEINNWILIVMIPVLGFLVFYIVMWLIDKVFIKKVYKLLTDLI
ncbi:MAG TPA: hypothetical protein VE912_05115, partial [Bacteroidales bacterium]|nr:hypothetical protein [Bacteroidales bacterium]